MQNRNNLVFVTGLMALCFALGEHVSAGGSLAAQQPVLVKNGNAQKVPVQVMNTSVPVRIVNATHDTIPIVAPSAIETKLMSVNFSSASPIPVGMAFGGYEVGEGHPVPVKSVAQVRQFKMEDSSLSFDKSKLEEMLKGDYALGFHLVCTSTGSWGGEQHIMYFLEK